MAVYTPNTTDTTASRKVRRNVHERRAHGHGHRHAHLHHRDAPVDAAAEAEKRAVGDVVVVTMNGQAVSWINMWDGTTWETALPTTSTSSLAASTPTSAVAADTTAVSTAAASSVDYSEPTTVASSAASSASTPAASGDWTRTAYYDADSQTSTGITFLGNYGGQGSGVFD